MDLQLQFTLVNTHFTLNLIAALIVFSVSWLHFDAWTIRRNKTEFIKMLGFLSLSLAFVANATEIDQTLLTTPLLGQTTITNLTSFLKLSGYLLIIIGQLIDPLQPLPSYRKHTSKSPAILPLLALPADQLTGFVHPLLASIVAFLYLRRATTGLEHHLKPISLGFFVLSLTELSLISKTFRDTTNTNIANLTAPFGPIWIIARVLLLFSVFVLGRWVWGYLIKRLESQLFIIFTATILGVFLVTTIFFTSTSIQNARNAGLETLQTSAKVLVLSINTLKDQALSNAEVLAQNPQLIQALNDNDQETLLSITQANLINKNQSSIVIVSQTAQVVTRAEDPDLTGGSLSNHPLITKALQNTSDTSITAKEGAIAPTIAIQASSPIVENGQVLGAVMVSSDIDNAFVDGLKQATNLESSIYAGNTRSATTFIASDGKSRWIGVSEENPNIKKLVLEDGQTFAGTTHLLNTQYNSVFAPLLDVDNNPVGMVFVGQPEIALLKQAAKSIELTFIATAFLLLLSTLPTYFISRYLVDQLKH